MQHNKWYSPTTHLVRLCRFAVTHFRNPAVFLGAAIMYAVLDIYGLRGTPAVIRWLYIKIKQQQEQMKNVKGQTKT